MFGGGALFSASQSGQTFTMGFGASQGGRAEPTPKKGRTEEAMTCLPVTVRSIEEAVAQSAAEGGDLRFYGAEAGMLVLVATVEVAVRGTTSLELVLNDATGRMKVRHYLNSEDPKELEGILPGAYVSVFGSVRTAPELHFAANGVRLVRSADEVSYHMIEAAHAALKLQQTSGGVPSGAIAATPQKASAGSFTPQKDSAPWSPAVASPAAPWSPPAASPEVPASPAPAAAASAAPLTGAALRAAVLSCVQALGNGIAQGVGIDAVCGKLMPTPEAEVRAVLRELVDDGEVFHTIDEEHFSCDV